MDNLQDYLRNPRNSSHPVGLLAPASTVEAMLGRCPFLPFCAPITQVRIFHSLRFIQVALGIDNGSFNFSYHDLRSICSCCECRHVRARLATEGHAGIWQVNENSLLFGNWIVHEVHQIGANSLQLSWRNSFGSIHESMYLVKIFATHYSTV